ncbi:MAG: hypothetical protein KF730_09725 [Sphingomonas sp.]|uniref:hypothetical protein n=1 Tax=Sphingomonas sp. TaxID=28214 RepID=UPI0025FDDD8A|nr:hypothetical protein [Sphingomonas sp.]MBX3564842.1 hypothetical protein [Sphingomonas sp.]
MTRFAVMALALLCAGCEGEAERAVRGQLVDPNSAQFSEVTTKNGVTCGLVNSKNRLGGYTGRKMFIFQGGQVYFWNESPSIDQNSLSACSSEAFSTAMRDFATDMKGQNQ